VADEEVSVEPAPAANDTEEPADGKPVAATKPAPVIETKTEPVVEKPAPPADPEDKPVKKIDFEITNPDDIDIDDKGQLGLF
jgi:topoisomerase-4 subunit A